MFCSARTPQTNWPPSILVWLISAVGDIDTMKHLEKNLNFSTSASQPAKVVVYFLSGPLRRGLLPTHLCSCSRFNWKLYMLDVELNHCYFHYLQTETLRFPNFAQLTNPRPIGLIEGPKRAAKHETSLLQYPFGVQRGGAGTIGHGSRTVGLGAPRGQRADGARVKDLPGNGAWAYSGRGSSVVGLQPFGQ